MKRMGLSLVAFLVVLAGFRVLSPAFAPEPAYHIVYILDRNASLEDDILRPDNLFKDMAPHKIDVAYSWADLLKFQSQQPLDALVIHDSALRMVDFEWVANAYWSGLTISTLGIRPAMLAHMFDDACLPYGYTMPVPEDGVYATLSTHLILSQHETGQVVKWYRRDWRRDCRHVKPVEVVKLTSTSYRYTSGPMMTDFVELYRSLLLDHIQVAEEEREQFKQERTEFNRVTVEALGS